MLVICEYARVCKTSSNSDRCLHGKIHEYNGSCEIYGCYSNRMSDEDEGGCLEAHCVDAFLEMVRERVEE